MFKKILKSFDYSIITVYILLCLFGLVMIYSASMVVAINYDVKSDFFYVKQLKNLALAFIAFGFCSFFPYKIYQSNKFLGTIMLLSVLGLIAIFGFGKIVNNANSWLKVGSSSIQPSEFVKLSVIIYLSAVYSKKQSYIDNFNKGVVPPLAFLILVCFLILIQPDTGTAAIIFLIGMTVILCSGMKLKTLMKLVSFGLVIALLLSPIVIIKKDKIFSPTKMGRITGFLDPFDKDVVDKEGHQLVNSYFAIGAGGIKGQGLGESIEKLGYLPEPHTDFIMAVIAEELGVFGVAFVIIGLAYIVLRGIYIGVKCKDTFGSLLAIGISSMIAIQTFINLGGVVGLIPITGVPLPLISYGGSSLLLLSISLGILVNVAMFIKYEEKYKKKKEKPVAAKSIKYNTFKVH
ncbi:FtsW/RodA/SpoVE family cell cycle protein [Heyndrickxia camelliae]|uniref:Probable peptidoglycan glycosyltransferase FtsW n=1 Tax=Heyndrickxia camelliae TaxID=1707093 RepID=A0A2N3LQW9_9BACI|nr:FtsW/RodA/SpoVE family cell cycle protein [Heyndrickxia camelliae]PKR86923.1 cell division protein FtsW [Heyndrickxia camelliae]